MTPTSSDKPGPPATVTGQAAPARGAEPEETDLWWGGYSIRGMVPTFVLCGVLSAGIILLATLLWAEAHPQVMWHGTMFLLIAVWSYALLRAAYLMTALNYRLTNRSLYRDRGFFKPGDGEVALGHVRQVFVERHAVDHLLGVGKVRILADDGRAIILEGLLHPEVVAADIRQAVEQARQRS